MPDLIGTEEKEDPESEGGHNLCGVYKAHETPLWLSGEGPAWTPASEKPASNPGPVANQPGPLELTQPLQDLFPYPRNGDDAMFLTDAK